MTNGRWRVLAAVRELIAERGVSPTLREVSQRTGLVVSCVHRHVAALCADGSLVRDPGSPRTLRLPPGPPPPSFVPLSAGELASVLVSVLAEARLDLSAYPALAEALSRRGLVVCRERG